MLNPYLNEEIQWGEYEASFQGEEQFSSSEQYRWTHSLRLLSAPHV